MRASISLRADSRLAARWLQLSKLAPVRHTGEALELLESSMHANAAATPASSDTPVRDEGEETDLPPAASQPRTDSDLPALLRNRDTSLRVWSTLRRQRVPWEASLALADAQLAVLPATQQAFVRRRTRGRPWDFSRAVLASWDRQDPGLEAVYRRLKACATTVAYAQQVTMALRTRPALKQVLPVPVDVMRQCYALGLAGAANGEKDAAEVAVALCAHLSVTGTTALSTRARETLAVDYARLLGVSGDWEAALSAVTQSGVVRLTIKNAFSEYAKQRKLCRDEDADRSARRTRTKDTQIPKLLPTPSTSQKTLAVLSHHQHSGTAKEPSLSRPELTEGAVCASPDGGALPAVPWLRQLTVFESLPPEKQSYGTVRPILESVPLTETNYITLCAHAMRHVGPRMYAGSLSRRLHAFSRRGQWALATALCCAGGYWDVAADLLPRLASVHAQDRAAPRTHGAVAEAVQYTLPPDLHLYMKTAQELRHPQPAAGPERTAPTATTAPSVSPVRSSELPVLLAHSLYGDWGAVASRVAAGGTHADGRFARLDALVAAEQISAGALPATAAAQRVHCYTYASPKVSQMVCGLAPEKERRYFAQVIPRDLHAHHFAANCSHYERARAAGVAEAAAPASTSALPQPSTDARADSYAHFLYSTNARTVESTEDCDWLLEVIAARVRCKPHSAAPASLLKALARACATGRVRLSASASFGLPLSLLKASVVLDKKGCYRAHRVDALVAGGAALSVPSHFLDASATAVAASVDALLLCGRADIVRAVYRRWSRKEKEDVEPIPCELPRGVTDSALSGPTHLADVFARAAFSVPRPQALQWSQRLWRDYHRPECLLLQELLVGDTRQVCDLLQGGDRRLQSSSQRRRRHSKSFTDRQTQSHRPPGTVGPARATGSTPVLSAAGRRHVMGMAFCLLDTTQALRFVVRAAGQQRVRAVDVDAHACSRLIRALPTPQALAAVHQLRQCGETVEELWLLSILAKRDAIESLAELRALVADAGTSAALASCYLVFLSAVYEANAPVLALKAVLRFALLLNTHHSYQHCTSVLYGHLAVMLHHFSACAAVAEELLRPGAQTQTAANGTPAPVRASAVAEANELSRRVLAAVVQNSRWESRLRKEQHELKRLAKDPSAVSPVLLMGWLHCTLSNCLQRPVPASLVSHLLRLAVEHTADGRSVWHFFRLLRSPTREERLLLLRGLASCPEDATARVCGSVQFLRGSPLLAVVWADRGHTSFAEKIAISRTILEGHGRHAGPRGELSPEEQGALAVVLRWKDEQCAQALKLLRVTGFLPGSSPPAIEAIPAAVASPPSQPSAPADDDRSDATTAHIVDALNTRLRELQSSIDQTLPETDGPSKDGAAVAFVSDAPIEGHQRTPPAFEK